MGKARAAPNRSLDATVRIVAVADVYDALGHARSYNTGLGPRRGRAYFRAQSGVLFEPRIVDALCQCFAEIARDRHELPGGAADLASHRQIKAASAAESQPGSVSINGAPSSDLLAAVRAPLLLGHGSAGRTFVSTPVVRLNPNKYELPSELGQA